MKKPKAPEPLLSSFTIDRDRLYTRAEAAFLLRVKPETLARWHCTRRFPTLVVTFSGDIPLYKGSDLLAHLEASRDRALEPAPYTPKRPRVEKRRGSALARKSA
jgi:hypothetical protein